MFKNNLDSQDCVFIIHLWVPESSKGAGRKEKLHKYWLNK